MKKKYLIISIISIISIIAVLLVVIVCYMFKPKRMTDIKDYQKIFDSRLESSLTLFPDDVKEENVKNFYYEYDTDFFFDNAQIILECSYDEEEYNQEIERLKTEKNEFWGGENEHGLAKYDEENFNYPAYVTLLGFSLSSEYALLDEENHDIVYIYIDGVSNGSIKFDKKYLPLGYDGGKCSTSYCQ